MLNHKPQYMICVMCVIATHFKNYNLFKTTLSIPISEGRVKSQRGKLVKMIPNFLCYEIGATKDLGSTVHPNTIH